MDFDKLRREFKDPEYAHAYADSFLDSYIATQIKILRESHEWTQEQLAKTAGMRQSRISTIEDVNYSAWSISTLRRLAKSFNVRLKVSFEEFGTLLPEIEKFSREYLHRRSLGEDPVFQDKETKDIPSALIGYQDKTEQRELGSIIDLNEYKQRQGLSERQKYESRATLSLQQKIPSNESPIQLGAL